MKKLFVGCVVFAGFALVAASGASLRFSANINLTSNRIRKETRK